MDYQIFHLNFVINYSNKKLKEMGLNRLEEFDYAYKNPQKFVVLLE